MFRKTLSVLAWVLIALLLAATLWAMQWASRQPAVHSIWGASSGARQPLALASL